MKDYKTIIEKYFGKLDFVMICYATILAYEEFYPKILGTSGKEILDSIKNELEPQVFDQAIIDYLGYIKNRMSQRFQLKTAFAYFSKISRNRTGADIVFDFRQEPGKLKSPAADRYFEASEWFFVNKKENHFRENYKGKNLEGILKSYKDLNTIPIEIGKAQATACVVISTYYAIKGLESGLEFGEFLYNGILNQGITGKRFNTLSSFENILNPYKIKYNWYNANIKKNLDIAKEKQCSVVMLRRKDNKHTFTAELATDGKYKIINTTTNPKSGLELDPNEVMSFMNFEKV
jgi:hypothetical protein